MHDITKRLGSGLVLALLAMPATGSLAAQEQDAPSPNIIVEGQQLPVDFETLAKGPEVKGIISARNGSRIRVATSDGASTIITVTEATRIKHGGLFGGRGNLNAGSLMNGLPVTIKTLQSPDGLYASQITFRKNDVRTASMIHNGTDQRFAEQTAATEALRGRMADIDQYNVKSTINVNFDVGKAVLSEQAKNDLCATASAAQAMDNALLLVVGYTDSTGSDEFNQMLSERRAGRVVNHLQQACGWKPYRMLTPTGMSESDPMADNQTEEGKAQNRRVAVNVLVSKGLDGL